jgi:uncharacterized membrane protein
MPEPKGNTFGSPEARREGLRRAHSPEARAKYSATMKRYRDEEREAVRVLRAKGLVPAAIADELGMSDLTVARHLRMLRRTGSL